MMKKAVPPSKSQPKIIPAKVRVVHELGSKPRNGLKVNVGDSEKMSKVISSPPMAAGVPVLELIRKLEDEKIMSRNDRAIVNDILNDPSERDKMVRIFRDIELASDRAASIKRLRNAIRRYKDGSNKKGDIISRNIAISTNQPNISLDVNPQDHAGVINASFPTSPDSAVTTSKASPATSSSSASN